MKFWEWRVRYGSTCASEAGLAYVTSPITLPFLAPEPAVVPDMSVVPHEPL
jgi:hypothetical protein